MMKDSPSLPELPQEYTWNINYEYPCILHGDRSWYYVWVYDRRYSPRYANKPQLTSQEMDKSEVHYAIDITKMSEQELVDTMFTIFTFMDKE